jgi:hypothetical protein
MGIRLRGMWVGHAFLMFFSLRVDVVSTEFEDVVVEKLKCLECQSARTTVLTLFGP